MIPREVLALVPGCEHGVAPRAVQALPGGRGCNLVLRIDTPAGRFVWRCRREPHRRPGSEPLVELRAQRAAAAAGMAPAVLAAADDGHWLLMAFEPAPAWTQADLQDPARLTRLGSRLAALHALPIPVEVPPVDALAIALGQLDAIQARDSAAAAECLVLAQRVGHLAEELRGWGRRPVLCHGDLQASNLLGPQPVLVDWEYTQVADPTYDLACLLTYYPELERQRDRIMGSAGMDRAEHRACLALQQQQFQLLNRLWERVEGFALDK